MVPLLAALAMLLGSVATAHSALKPKIDNFFFLIDTSGSMGAEYQQTGKTKYQLARELAMRMNALIPELGYEGAVATLAPFEMLQPLQPYTEGGYDQSLQALPENVRFWFGNPTPLGQGLSELRSRLPSPSQRTALILFSDGGNNKGRNPIPVAQGIYKKYEGNLCFHVISFAETAKEQATLDSIAALSKCTLLVSYPVLKDDQELKQFVQEVFYKNVVVDTDQDGVNDDQDHCPGTPRNVQVDVVGCPVDSDGDGVPDYLDKCPDTPLNLKVDAKGCPLPVTFNLKIEFNTGKADIRPQYRGQLQKVANFLKSHPDTTAMVEGHTDSSGAADYNLKLSQRRADSVMDYLETEFNIKPGRLSAKGYGETKPIASNENKEGMQANRRVLVIISGAYEQK
jgi:OOP family OmpA-OmpF porin